VARCAADARPTLLPDDAAALVRLSSGLVSRRGQSAQIPNNNRDGVTEIVTNSKESVP